MNILTNSITGGGTYLRFNTILKNPDYKLKIHIDDHLNIIIPEIKTIIISNYAPGPFYALYSIYNK